MSQWLNIVILGMIFSIGITLSNYDVGMDALGTGINNATETFTKMNDTGLGNSLIKGIAQIYIPIFKILINTGISVGHYLGIHDASFLIVGLVVLTVLMGMTPSILWIIVAICILVKDWRKSRKEGKQ